MDAVCKNVGKCPPTVRLFTLPRRERLTRSRDVRAVFDAGRARSDRNLRVLVRPNGLPYNRLCVAVNRKAGKAHRRNLLKRRLREVFRLTKEDTPKGYDVVVIPRPGVSTSLEELKDSFIGIMSRMESAGQRGRSDS